MEIRKWLQYSVQQIKCEWWGLAQKNKMQWVYLEDASQRISVEDGLLEVERKDLF